MRGRSKGEKNQCHIGIDLMGSDSSPDGLLSCVLDFARSISSDVHLTLFATAEVFSKKRKIPPQVTFHLVEEVISMDEPPLTAIRRKKNSSICAGIRLLKEGTLHAFISAGNTGALMGCAKLQLPALPHVDRPSLLTLLPTQTGDLAVLDVGANTSTKAKYLVQNAAMGAAYQRSRGIKEPRVALLNIGSEAMKGTPELQEAYHQLEMLGKKKSAGFIFHGNVEGRDVFHGGIDVLVTDGFTGNVFLKTAEGIAAAILDQFEKAALEGCTSELKKMISGMRTRLHYAEYPGALLCGIDAIVIKCHGNISSDSLTRSVTTAERLIKHAFLEQIKKTLGTRK